MPLSEEQKKAQSERMKAMHAARRAAKEAVGTVPEAVPAVTEQPTPVEAAAPAPEQPLPGVTMTNEQFAMLLDRFTSMAKPDNNKIEAVGVIERFPIAQSAYANPVEELYDLPKLRRFGLRENFVIDWKVTPTKYETRQGQWYMEPRFELTLKKKQFNEDGEEITKTDKNGKVYHPRIILGRASFFVDPPADLIEADLAGLGDADLTDEEMRTRMFFWRYAMWIEERLVPKRPDMETNTMKEEVIGGKVYQIEEYSMPL